MDFLLVGKLKTKLEHLFQIKNDHSCVVSKIVDGWVINGLLFKSDELPNILLKALSDPTIKSKQRTSVLIVMKKIGKDILKYFPRFTRVVLTTWYTDKKLIEQYLQTIGSLFGGLTDYLASLSNHLFLADISLLLEVVKKTDCALVGWKKAVALKKDFFYGWVRLSLLYYHLNNLSEAIMTLLKGIEFFGFDIPRGTNKEAFGVNYMHDVELLINLLLKKEKQNYILLYVRGLILSYFYRDFHAAIPFFLRCLKINPTFLKARFKLAAAFGKIKNKKAQIGTLQKIIEEMPEQKEALSELATIWVELKNYALAVQYYKMLHDLEPNNERWLLKLMALYKTSILIVGGPSEKVWKRDLEQAYYYCQKLVKLGPRSYETVDHVYNFLKELNKLEEARDVLLDFLVKNGLDERVLKKLEQVHHWLKIPFDQRKIEQEVNFHRNKDKVFPKILELLSQVRPNIPITLPRIAKFVDFPEEKMEVLLKNLISENPSVGEYLELEQVFIRKENTDVLINNLKVQYSTCYYCGMPIEQPESPICSACGKELLKCNVCKLPISFGELIGQCSLCETKGHLHHLEEWVKTQGKCPSCLQELPLQGVIPVEVPFKKK